MIDPLIRLNDAKEAIARIREILDGRSSNSLSEDLIIRLAYERLLEIVSESCRHLPQALKDTEPHIPWRQIADLGNVLRHAYRKVDHEDLWGIYAKDLDPLDNALDHLIRRTRET